ncbi:MAG: hypothetical protein U0640_11885 [Phycisphaerales bacterium]
MQPKPHAFIPRVCSLALIAATLFALLPMSGCVVVDRMRGRRVAIEGDPASLPLPFIVQIENKLGTVKVFADPKLKQPVVYASIMGKKEPRLAKWVAASIENQSEQRILRVLSADPALDKIPVILDIRVPAIAGTMIRNNGGKVTLRNVAGPIQVYNGITDGNGGDVDVITEAALAGPVTIQARNGNVRMAMGKGSIGKLDLAGKKGVSVDAPNIAMVGVTGNRTTLNADLGVWGQPFKLQANEGKVFLQVRD